MTVKKLGDAARRRAAFGQSFFATTLAAGRRDIREMFVGHYTPSERAAVPREYE